MALTIALVATLVPALAAAGAQDDPPALTATPITNTTAPGLDPLLVDAKVNRLATSEKMGSAGTLILDPADESVLYEDEGRSLHSPASTLKIVTAATALQVIDPQTTFATTTGLDRATGTLYLVGGGDPLLGSGRFQQNSGAEPPPYPAPTSLRALVRATAQELSRSGTSTVRLAYDDTLFTGPSFNSRWFDRWLAAGVVGPVSALTVDDGQTGDGGRVGDPAADAGKRFAVLLRKRGIDVTSVSAGRAPSDAEELAVIRSAPLHALISQMLAHSDNDTAEVLFRHSGLASGYPGSFSGGRRATRHAMGELGLSTLLARFEDGSGLSEQNRISPVMLTNLLARVVNQQDGLWPIASGLPVAGATGTLSYRFRQSDTSAGAGLVRAKTGTLVGTTSLAGFTRTRSGRVVVFASIANDADSAWDASHVIDRMISRVVRCGCR